MKVAILGYGKEGQSSEKYFQNHGAEVKVWEHITPKEVEQTDFSDFDLVLRSPGIRPPANKELSSQTKYFFAHCPAPIIGVTGTKGKGTTCSIITSVLGAIGENVYLVGNIGTPPLDLLDKIKSTDIIIYEMSNFQLWDLHQSPHIAAILRLEPDHLDIHKDYTEYINAKSNITKHQTADDYCIYYHNNADSSRLAKYSPGTRIAYPTGRNRTELLLALQNLALVGPHNAENAEAALAACAAYYQMPLDDFLQKYRKQIAVGLSEFRGLPHRLEFVRSLNDVDYYDDNFATNLPSTRAAIDSFTKRNTVLIAGGRDKTHNRDLPELASLFNESSNIKNVVLIGESGHDLAAEHPSDKFAVAESLAEAVNLARKIAESLKHSVVVMSPAAASFDMFSSYYERGEAFQKLVKDLQ